MKQNKGQYFGSQCKIVNANSLTLSLTSYANVKYLPAHIHVNPYFCYVVRGTYEEYYSRRKIVCHQGDILFHEEFTEHKNYFIKDNVKCFNLELSDLWVNKLKEIIIPSSSKSNNFLMKSLLKKIIFEFNNYDELSNLVIEGLTLELIVNYKRSNSISRSTKKYLNCVKEYLNDEYFNNPSLTQISQIVNLTAEHISREFKNEFKMTIGDYLRKLKVKRASYLLLDTNKSLTEIALETGFSDQSHFIRIFKKYTGLTPLQYKQIN